MFKIRDLMVHTASAAGAARLAGGIICYWPSNDCCGAFWSNPGGGGPGNVGTTRWLTAELEAVECVLRTFRPGGCGVNYSTCPEGSVWTLRAHVTAVVNPADLKALRQELEVALELANERQDTLDKEYTPSTVADINQLEKQLKGALVELQKRKKELAGE